jgi:predicted dithiol-disulfide oxidoreductase (DUF899 family)
MPDHKVGTREEWQAARDELAKLEAEQAERNEEIKRKRLELPWVPVEKEYELDTEDGKKTLAELFDGRSQVLAYKPTLRAPRLAEGRVPGLTAMGGLGRSVENGGSHEGVWLAAMSREPSAGPCVSRPPDVAQSRFPPVN